MARSHAVVLVLVIATLALTAPVLGGPDCSKCAAAQNAQVWIFLAPGSYVALSRRRMRGLFLRFSDRVAVCSRRGPSVICVWDGPPKYFRRSRARTGWAHIMKIDY